MSNNKQGIRTIHDAIDAKVSRAISAIRTAKSKRETEIEKTVHDKLGITEWAEQFKAITGKSPKDNYRYYEDNSPLALAMKEAKEELTPFDNAINTIQIKAEDCHIQVVTGEMGEVLKDLDKTIAELSAKIK